ncbi:MAG: hypothetical protein K8R50_03530 [Betaproteobacteria bacterium]|nr:hypothetical protein [Betaproteobacteria bacterium]
MKCAVAEYRIHHPNRDQAITQASSPALNDGRDRSSFRDTLHDGTLRSAVNSNICAMPGLPSRTDTPQR